MLCLKCLLDIEPDVMGTSFLREQIMVWQYHYIIFRVYHKLLGYYYLTLRYSLFDVEFNVGNNKMLQDNLCVLINCSFYFNRIYWTLHCHDFNTNIQFLQDIYYFLLKLDIACRIIPDDMGKCIYLHLFSIMLDKWTLV